MIDLDLEELTLSELLEVETALVTFMLSILLLRCCHIIVEVGRLILFVICSIMKSWLKGYLLYSRFFPIRQYLAKNFY